MKIYVVGSSKNKFLPLDNIREKFLIDKPHDGVNIDFLNPWYCELTGLYYLWKHVDDDIVGLEHYRTYFWKNDHPISKDEIYEELQKGDIICSGWKMPNPFHGGKNVREEFSKVMKHDYLSFINLLKETQPKFYNFFDEYLNNNSFICCNMFIAPKIILDKYMNFMLNTIVNFELQSKPNNSNFRREGWISEFMFGAWLNYEKLKKVYVNINKLKKDLLKTEFYSTNPNNKVQI